MSRLLRVLGILNATLREIFDESAYDRFLELHQVLPGRDSYAAFRRELEGMKARRPKCC
jgi:hypothetical protein